MLQLDRDVAATIVRLVHDLTNYHAIICDERATIVADSAGTRVGQAHEGARRILQGMTDVYRVTAAESAASGGAMKEGVNRAIRDKAQKIGTFGIAGPLAVVEPIANLAAEIVLVRLADKARDQLIKGALQQCIDDTNRAVGTAAVSVHQLNGAFDGLAASSAEMVRVAQRSAEHLKAISQMLEMIRKVAVETRMLGLNAAVEAARAGRHGEGFAVVAAGVRKLADESGRSAAEIGDIMSQFRSAFDAVLGTSQRSAGVVLTERASVKEAEDKLVALESIGHRLAELAAQL